MDDQITETPESAPKPLINWLLVTGCLAAGAAILIVLVYLNILPPIWIGDEYDENRHQIFDETSQRWMALSAVLSLLISTGTLMLLWGTLTVTIGMLNEARRTTAHAAATLLQTERSADAANASLAISKELARKQAQAYVDVSEARVVVGRDNGEYRVKSVEFNIRNVGQTPTTLCLIDCALERISMRHSPPQRRKVHIPQEGRGSIAAGATPKINLHLDTFLISGETKLHLTGKIVYRTVYDEYFESEVNFSVLLTSIDLFALPLAPDHISYSLKANVGQHPILYSPTKQP